MSTNAGGVRLMRYGSLRGSILGLEAVSVDNLYLLYVSCYGSYVVW